MPAVPISRPHVRRKNRNTAYSPVGRNYASRATPSVNDGLRTMRRTVGLRRRRWTRTGFATQDRTLSVIPTRLSALLPGRPPSSTVTAVSDAHALLRSMKGRSLRTVTGRENRVLRVDQADVLVWTTRSPGGQAVPIAWVQDALDRLERDGEIEISVASVGHRSAFVGAVLLQLPGAHAVRTSSPPRIRLAR